MLIEEWAPTRFHLSRQYEASGGPYNLRSYPYMVEILQAFANPAVEKISIIASTQVGKTLFVQVALAYAAVTDPAPALICLPNQAAAIEFRDRFYGNAMESAELRDRVPPERKWNTRHIDLKTSRVYLAWAGSRQRLRGRACRYVILSEVDVYQRTMAGDPVRVAEERTKKFYRRKIVQESTPVGEESPIAAEYEAGDKRRWYGRCPECGRFQELRFFTFQKGDIAGRGGIAGYRGDDGELLQADEARAGAYYICLNGCEIRDDRKLEMVTGGRWVRAGQDIDQEGRLTGTPTRSDRHASFHLWSIHSNTVTIADIAEAFIRHVDGGQLGEFFENWLGLKYSTSKRVPRWRRVAERLAGSYSRGYVWPEAWFLTSGVDVQEDVVYWSVRAWGGGIRSWLVDWGVLQRYPDQEKPDGLCSDLDQLTERVLNRRWPVHGGQKTPLGKSEVGVKLLAIDSNYRTTDVRRWIDDVRSKRVRAVIGDTRTVKAADRFRRTRIERTENKKSKRGMEVWRVNVNVYKEDLMERIVSGCDGKDDSFRFPSDIGRLGATFLKQLVNERKRIVEDRYGRKRMEWVVHSKSTGEHGWDTEVYSRAAADMVLADQRLDWNSANWPLPREGDDQPVEMLGRAARE